MHIASVDPPVNIGYHVTDMTLVKTSFLKGPKLHTEETSQNVEENS